MFASTDIHTSFLSSIRSRFPQFLFLAFVQTFMSMSASDASGGAGASSFAGCSDNIRADAPFLLSDSIHKYGVHLDLQRFMVMDMKVNSVSV